MKVNHLSSEKLAEMLAEQTELLFHNGPQKQIQKYAQGELFVLRCLDRVSEPLLPSDLSEQVQTSSARIATILNTLEKKELIVREIDPSDRRRILVTLTPEGKEYTETIRKKIQGKMVKLLEKLGEDDAREYIRITKRIIEITQEETL